MFSSFCRSQDILSFLPSLRCFSPSLAVAQRFKAEFERCQQQLPGSDDNLANDLSKLTVQDDKENQDKTAEEAKGTSDGEGGDKITTGNGDTSGADAAASSAHESATKDDEPANTSTTSKEEASVTVGDT